MFFYFKWYIKRRTSVLGQLEEYRTEVYRLIAEINAVTDRDSQLVEDRIEKLRAVLDETDKRISVYVKELEKSRTGEALYASLGRGIRAALNNTDVKPPPQLSAVRPNVEVQQQLFSAPLEKTPLSQSSQVTSPVQSAVQGGAQVQKPSSKRQIRASIDLLANEGLPPAEIASRLDISIAEVDLAMNLRRRKKS
ncbi:MAG: hypothetical protein FWF68_08250 [Spirochaetes bacterium]|nr:hypothetical protein [Brevinematales bacterium]MCL1959576.1 hypothetical protein [Spirochaetota bacterium]